MAELTQERMKELLDYDPATGVFRWRVRSNNRVRVGDVAGSFHNKGYRAIKVDGKDYLAHRLAWLYVNGRWPRDQIDHINGVKDDNRICNLREATHAENMQNQRRAQSDNKSSGLLGASWHGQSGRWEAGIKHNGKRLSLGLYDTAEEAHRAYLTAKGVLHPFNTLGAA